MKLSLRTFGVVILVAGATHAEDRLDGEAPDGFRMGALGFSRTAFEGACRKDNVFEMALGAELAARRGLTLAPRLPFRAAPILGGGSGRHRSCPLSGRRLPVLRENS